MVLIGSSEQWPGYEKASSVATLSVFLSVDFSLECDELPTMRAHNALIMATNALTLLLPAVVALLGLNDRVWPIHLHRQLPELSIFLLVRGNVAQVIEAAQFRRNLPKGAA